MDNTRYIANVLEEFEQVTKRPENFLNCEDPISQDLKSKLKLSYDFLKNEEILSSKALPELLINNFDTEQIWQQIELQNDSCLNNLVKNVSRLVVTKDRLVFDNLADKAELSVEGNENLEISGDVEQGNNSAEDIVDGDNSPDDDLGNKLGSKDLEQYSSNDDSEVDLHDRESDTEVHEEPETVKKKKKSAVDDTFFKLDEMEQFLASEEKKLDEPKPAQNNDEDDGSESEASVDLFKSSPEDSDEESKVKTAKFKDFFVASDDVKEPKRNKFLEGMNDDEEVEHVKSTFELRQERLNKKIEKMEEIAIGEKPWTLKGEITAESRPVNSLLEEVLEFDMSNRPAPVITEKTTLQLEDIIRQCVKEKNFDSVSRKEKPVETLLEYKKKLVLDQEKSKHSLAQIYEKEFMDQQASLDPENAAKEEEEPELHKEIKQMTTDLFAQLDALSNFHFTPKPAIPELKIVTNLPAVVMEEVAPVTASDAAVLAPEEVRNKPKGDETGKSERTKTDKKRERRKKKIKQQKHVQKIISKNLIVGGKDKKQSVKEMTKHRNVEKMDEKLNSKTFKSSKGFFSHLQEQVQSHISAKKHEKKNDKNKNMAPAKKYKL